MKSVITTNNAPMAIGPYSQGVQKGTIVVTSGQLPIDPITGEMPTTIDAQTKQSLNNVKAILEAKGLSMEDIVKTTVFLSDMANFKAMNEVYSTYFDGEYPCRSAFEVARLPMEALVEIEVLAVV